jgi:hypothetical protein
MRGHRGLVEKGGMGHLVVTSSRIPSLKATIDEAVSVRDLQNNKEKEVYTGRWQRACRD